MREDEPVGLTEIDRPCPTPTGEPVIACALAPESEPACAREAVVRIVDRTEEGAPGCAEHAARALRAIAGARVYPLPGHDGAAIEVYRSANA